MIMNTLQQVSFFGRSQRSYFSAVFELKSIFNEDLHHEDVVPKQIWWQIFLTLSTQNSEYLQNFSKPPWEHAKPDPNFQVTKAAIFSIFDHFLSFREPCWKIKDIFLI